jgi:hypothetical protein
LDRGLVLEFCGARRISWAGWAGQTTPARMGSAIARRCFPLYVCSILPFSPPGLPGYCHARSNLRSFIVASHKMRVPDQ